MPTTVPGPSVVVSGPLPPNHAELSASKRMHDLLEAAGRDFDLSSATRRYFSSRRGGLAARCDGVILVVRMGGVSIAAVQGSGTDRRRQGRILGVVLNRVDMRSDGYYAEYHRHYSGHHGEDAKG